MSQYQWEDGGDASNPEEPVEAPRLVAVPLKHKKTFIEDDITTDSYPHHDAAADLPSPVLKHDHVGGEAQSTSGTFNQAFD
jgi:hypothetical protein